jgi:uncharacterized protein (DUF433 family)
MNLAIHSEAPPLRPDGTGAIRVGNSRVLLELVLEAHEEGASPREIVARYPTLKLEDVYAVVGYALRHPDDINTYLAAREGEANRMDAKISASQKDLSKLAAQVRSRRKGST